MNEAVALVDVVIARLREPGADGAAIAADHADAVCARVVALVGV